MRVQSKAQVKALNHSPQVSPSVRFGRITVTSCTPINNDSAFGYEVKLVVDKSGAEKFKAFASSRNQSERPPGQIEIPITASYVYGVGPQKCNQVLVGDQTVFKGSPLETLFRHLVKAMPVDDLVKKSILNTLEKTQPVSETKPVSEAKQVQNQKPVSPESVKPSQPVQPSAAFQAQPAKPQPQVSSPTAATLIRQAHAKAVGSAAIAAASSAYLQDPQHPQAPPVKVSVSVKLGPVTLVTR